MMGCSREVLSNCWEGVGVRINAVAILPASFAFPFVTGQYHFLSSFAALTPFLEFL
jgi:hypothetical protein